MVDLGGQGQAEGRPLWRRHGNGSMPQAKTATVKLGERGGKTCG
jgi:hypothetical protein